MITIGHLQQKNLLKTKNVELQHDNVNFSFPHAL